MHVLLFLAGLVSLAAGIATVAYGFVNPGFHPTEAMLVSASVGAVGGFLLLGLGAALLQLRRLGDFLETRSFMPAAAGMAEAPPFLPRPPLPPVLDPPAMPAPAAPPPAAESAAPPAAEKAEKKEAAAEWPHVAPVDRPAPVEAAPRNTPAGAVAAALDLAPAPAASPAPAAAPDQPPAPERRILKSGVIEGMAYTLYSDGSVDAELKEGLMHFASIAAWRAHMRETA